MDRSRFTTNSIQLTKQQVSGFAPKTPNIAPKTKPFHRMMPYPPPVVEFGSNHTPSLIQSTSTKSRFDSNSLNQELTTSDNEKAVDKSRPNIFGKSSVEKLYCFTGTIERVIKWHRIFQSHFCIFEIIASIVSMQEGQVKLQKILLLRDHKGPILQVIHYLINDIQLEDFNIGQKLRCVGNMTGHNIMTAFSIRSATPEEVASLQRHCYIGDYAITRMLNDDEKLFNEQRALVR